MSGLLEKAKRQFHRGDLKIAQATLGRAIREDRSNPEAHILLATIHEQQGDLEEAARIFAAVIPLTANLKREVAFRAAQHYLSVGRSDGALGALVALHGAMPDDRDVNHSICALLREAGRYPEAIPFALKLSTIGTDFDNWLNAGIVLSGMDMNDIAYPLLQKAQTAKPDERLAVSELFWCAANLCDFPVSDAMQATLEAAYASEGDKADTRENVFRALTWSGNEAYHAKTAWRTAEVMFPPVNPVRPPLGQVEGRRIRIGYVSCDFFDHATMALFAGVLEAHDRERFEVFGFCHTAAGNRHGAMRERFLAGVEHYVDILGLDDAAAAASISAAGIDILVDLKGFTQGNRLGIFCRRPAPIQVTYLGFPGSVAGVGIDYALTDAIVTPEGSAPHYAETLLRLPFAYQCNDNSRAPVSRTGARAEHGLPVDAVVFSAFHQAPKIRSDVFAAWISILKDVPGSVLWLADQKPEVRDNLRKAAHAAGIEPDRLVFAEKRPLDAHLARLAEADIALDTAPYNGHTTTSDALWAGVPVLTWKGTSFAGRVSESLLAAVGLPELVANDINGFGRLAVELAQDGPRQARLRQHLIDARATASLFDTAGTTRAIEAHFERLCRPA